MKEVRYGVIPREYEDKEGKRKTAWDSFGYTGFFDWDERKACIVDNRTGAKFHFFSKEKSTTPTPQNDSFGGDDVINF